MSQLLVSDVELDFLRIGDFVQHDVYGLGTIESILISTITIRFIQNNYSMFASHAEWNDTKWMGLGLQFTEDDGSLSIKRNDASDFPVG